VTGASAIKTLIPASEVVSAFAQRGAKADLRVTDQNTLVVSQTGHQTDTPPKLSPNYAWNSLLFIVSKMPFDVAMTLKDIHHLENFAFIAEEDHVPLEVRATNVGPQLGPGAP
jgi:hypothetical protein